MLPYYLVQQANSAPKLLSWITLSTHCVPTIYRKIFGTIGPRCIQRTSNYPLALCTYCTLYMQWRLHTLYIMMLAVHEKGTIPQAQNVWANSYQACCSHCTFYMQWVPIMLLSVHKRLEDQSYIHCSPLCTLLARVASMA